MRSLWIVAALLPLKSTAWAAPLLTAADRFDAAMEHYRSGRRADALEQFLFFVAQEPRGPKSEDALRWVWTIAEEAKEADRRLTFDGAQWRESVRLAHDAVQRRREQARRLVDDLESLSRALSKDKDPLNALRKTPVDFMIADPSRVDAWARDRAEGHLASIRQALKRITENPAPDPAQLHEARGYFWFYQGDLELAVKEWEQASRHRSGDNTLRSRLDQARAQLEADRRSERISHELRLGASDFRVGRYAKALPRFQRVLAWDPANEEARRYARLAEKAIEEASRQEQVQGLLIDGRKLYEEGRFLDAVQRWVDALALEPGNEEARRYLSRVQRRLTSSKVEPTQTARPAQGPPPRGQEAAGKAKEAYTLGLIQYTDGDLKAAERSFLEALSLKSDFEKAQRGLEQVRAELKKR